MPPLPVPPAPRPADASVRLPFARPDHDRAFGVDVPRYFIEVKVPGYSVEKTVAHARKRQPSPVPATQPAGADALRQPSMNPQTHAPERTVANPR